MILLLIALIISLFAALSLGLAYMANIEHQIVTHRGTDAQLVQIVQSGIDSAGQAIDDFQRPDIFDNPALFCSIEVVPGYLTPRNFGAGRFTVYSPRIEEEQLRGIRFGLTRESAKLSLESVLAWENESPGLGAQALQNLPGINSIIVDSILDWLDADDDPRPQGAESDWYRQQGKSYGARNALIIALEELLLIREVDRSMIFGDDHQFAFGGRQANLRHNVILPEGLLDPFAPLDLQVQHYDSQSYDSRGSASAWQFLLTPYSAEKMVNPQNVVRVFLNESNLEFLESQLRLHQLDEESIQFILAWRNVRGRIVSPLDMLDAEVKVDEYTTLTSPFSCSDAVMYERFLRLLDEAVSDSAIIIRGRINVNEAPRCVLEAVPELTPEITSAILEHRQLGAVRQRHAVWLLAEGIVDLGMMRTLFRRLTTGGDVYRIHVVGFFEEQPMLHRVEVVLDATVKPPRTVFYKDLTPLEFPE